MVSLSVFLGCYLLFVLAGHWRAYIAVAGVALLIGFGVVSFREAILHMVNWNVVALFFGTLILADLFLQSRLPAVMAEWCIDRTKTVRGAFFAIFLLASFLSMFIENVAVVLLVAPVALSLCEKLKVNPILPMIFLALFSNLQGTATLIGDPPSMILAGYMKMGFNDFFVYEGKPGIFFVIQVGMIGALGVALFFMRHLTQRINLIPVEVARSLVPLYFLIVFVLLLAVSTYFDPDFSWFAGTVALCLAAISLVWYRLGPHWSSVRTLITQLDWDTTLFLAALFVIVGALEHDGWIDALSTWLREQLSGDLLTTYIVVILISTLISAFVDNVPYLLTMLPVVDNISRGLDVQGPLLMFALLVGVCLGGNISPFGASANVVTVGILRKQGHEISWPQFLKIGTTFTVAALVPGSLFLWYFYGP